MENRSHNGGVSTVTQPLPEAISLALEEARRTAFVARFIVLREAKRTKAHRVIERMEWERKTTAEELYARFRQAFVDNKDNMGPVDRDMKRAVRHADRDHIVVGQFIREYQSRATTSFIDALYDYGRSNSLLFGDEDQPKSGGWRMPNELEKERDKERATVTQSPARDQSGAASAS